MLVRSGRFASSLIVAATAGGLVFCAASCASSKPVADATPADSTAHAEAPPESGSTSDASAPGPDASSTPAAPGDPAPRPAEERPARGVEPLTQEEERELESRCKPYAEAVRQHAAVKLRHQPSNEELLDKLGEVAPGDKDRDQGMRCQQLLRRGLIETIASRREAEAIVSLKKMVFGMSESFAAQKKLCPSTEAVPSSTDVLKGRAYEASRTDYATPAWKCARFDTLGAPQRFQLAIEVDEAQKSYRAIARGYAVDGGALEQLFVEMRVKDGALEPSGSVMRK